MESGHSARIGVLQILRLFAASMIILYHTDLTGGRGFFGVQIFFVISGFLAVHTTRRPVSSGLYLCKRCIRLIPLYWIFTLITFLILTLRPGISNMSDSDPLHFLYSLLFIPFRGKTGAILPILAVGWTMQYEMAFTLLFALALLVFPRHRVLAASFFLLALTAVGLFLKPKPLFLNYYTDSHLFVFFLGLLAGWIYEKCRGAVPPGHSVLSGLSGPAGALVRGLFLLLALGSFLFLVLDVSLPFRLHHSFRMGIPAALLVFALVMLTDRVVFPPKLLKLCDMTYSVFFVEYFTTSVYKRLVPESMSPFLLAVSLAALFAATFALAVIPYFLVEVRLTAFLRRLLLPSREVRKEA